MTTDGGSVSDPVLMGRVHGADGLITEAYAFTVVGDDTAFEVAFAADPTLSAANPGFVSAITIDTRVHAALVIAEPASIGTYVAAAAGAVSFTQQFENVTQDFANGVTFGLRPNSANPDSVPTAWLAGYGKDENEPLVSSDLKIGDKYALDIDPYAVHTVLFGIESFTVTGGVADVTVKLLVNGDEHDHINGALQLDGRPTLDADWETVGGTPITGTIFSNGTYNYQIQTDPNRFFQAVVR